MKMTFLKLFLICTFKDPKLVEKWTNFTENPKKKLNSAEFMEFVISKSGHRVAMSVRLSVCLRHRVQFLLRSLIGPQTT